VTVPVLAAVTGAAWEAELVAALERAAGGVTVVRRCVDLADLLAAAATGTATAALVSADLRRLDRDALSRLAASGVAPVGLFTPGDTAAAQRLRGLGVAEVLPADAAAADIAAAVGRARGALAGGAAGVGGPDGDRSAARAEPQPGPADGAATQDGHVAGADGQAAAARRGRLVAVWGPTGAPGRTTVAVTLAAELAGAGVPTLLADADVYGGVVGQLLGLLDEAPGLAAAARLANQGRLDLPALARLAPVVAPRLRVLTGVSRAARWPELRPVALEQVWALSRALAEVTVVDCGFCLEQDEELAYDTAAPRRNGATLRTLELADTVLAVGAADPVGVQRLVRGLAELREAVPGAAVRVVLNRVRRTAVGAGAREQLTAALERHAGVTDVVLVPEDRQSVDSAVLHGRVLAEVARGSPARLALAGLAAALLGRPAPARPGGLAGRRRLAGAPAGR
jgi:Flp pilus assembly CpaE family ATPase